MKYAVLVAFILVFAGSAAAESLGEYLEKVNAARESARAAIEDPSRAAEAGERLSELENLRVVGPDGETYAAANRWAGEMARSVTNEEGGIAAREALGKLDAVAREIESLRDDESAPLDAELSMGEEFGESALKPTIEDSELGVRERLRRMSEWMRRQERESGSSRRSARASSGGSIDISPGVFWVIVIVMIGIILGVIAYQIATSRTSKPPSLPKVIGARARSVLEDALKRTPQEWKQLAREYFEKGEYTQALRALYLSLLVVLHRRRLISYDTSKTNWEYVWEIGPSRAEVAPFQALTKAFDYKWYGRAECSSGEYLELERMADRVVGRKGVPE